MPSGWDSIGGSACEGGVGDAVVVAEKEEIQTLMLSSETQSNILF